MRDATISSSGNISTSVPARDEAIAGPSSSSTHSRNESGNVLQPPRLNKTGRNLLYAFKFQPKIVLSKEFLNGFC